MQLGVRLRDEWWRDGVDVPQALADSVPYIPHARSYDNKREDEHAAHSELWEATPSPISQ